MQLREVDAEHVAAGRELAEHALPIVGDDRVGADDGDAPADREQHVRVIDRGTPSRSLATKTLAR